MKERIFKAILVLPVAASLLSFPYQQAKAQPQDGVVLRYERASRSAAAEFTIAPGPSGRLLYGVLAEYGEGKIKRLRLEPFFVEANAAGEERLTLDAVSCGSGLSAFLWDQSLAPLAQKAHRASAETLYVSPGGSDGGDGSRERPFLTVGRAAQAARAAKAAAGGDIVVRLMPGTYHVEAPIVFTPDDSGENGHSIIYEGEDGAVVSGGRPVGGFSPVPGKPYWQADLDMDGFLYEFYMNGHRARVASTEEKYQALSLYDDPATPQESDGFLFAGEMLPFSVEAWDGMLASNAYEWVYHLVPVEKFLDRPGGARAVTFRQPYAGWYGNFLKPQYPLYFLNHLSFLDRPGEFYYHRTTKKLYYYPFPGEEPGDAMGYAPVSEGLISIQGTPERPVENLVFSNLTFRHGQWKRTWEKGFAANQAENYIDTPEDYNWFTMWEPTIPGQFRISYASGIHVAGSRFENLSAVALQFLDGVSDSSAKGNIFYDIGAAAVTVGRGSHQEPLLQSADRMCKSITVENNLIRETGQIYQSSPAITAYYVSGCKILHNDIENVPYTGISLGWGWGNDEEACAGNEISYNRIVNVMGSLWDGSHIYTLGNLGGSVISGNYMGRTREESGGGGYYPDQGSAQVLVRENVTENPRSWNIGWENKNVTYQENYVDVLKERTSYGDIDSLQRTGFSVHPGGDWPQAARQVIENAGLTEEYRFLISELEGRNAVENIFGSDLDWYFAPGALEVRAGDFLTGGGEGAAFHDSDDWNQFDGLPTGPDWGGRRRIVGYGGAGEWLTYRVIPAASGRFDLYARAAALHDSACDVYLNGSHVIYNAPLKVTGDWSLYEASYLGAVSLKAGQEYHIRFYYRKGIWNFDSLLFVPAETDDRVFDPAPPAVVLAEEDFESYTQNGIFADGVSFRDYPAPGQSSLTGGTGWQGKWSPSYTDDTASFTSQVPMLSAHFGNTAYGYSGAAYYRRLQSPVDLTAGSTVTDIRFDLVAQQLAVNKNAALLLFGNQLKIGLAADAGSGANRPSISMGTSSATGESLVPYGNIRYHVLARLLISPARKDTVLLKIYEGEEPASWSASLELEICPGTLDGLGFVGTTAGGGVFIDNIQVKVH